MTENDVRGAIDRDTRITLGAALAAAIAFFSMVLWIDRRITGLEHQVSSLATVVETAAADRWRRSEMYLWAEVMRANNPDIIIPEIPNAP